MSGKKLPFFGTDNGGGHQIIGKNKELLDLLRVIRLLV